MCTTIQFVPMSQSVAVKMAATVASLDNERAQSASQTIQTNLTVCGKSKACTEFQIISTNQQNIFESDRHFDRTLV